MYFSSDCFLESVGNCQPEKFVKRRKNIKVSPRFGVSVPYFHGGNTEGHFEVLAMSGRGSTESERYLPTTNEKPSETMFQRVLLDFVLKTFGLGAENETRTRDPNLGKVVLYQLSYFRICYVAFSSVSLALPRLEYLPSLGQGCALPTELFPHLFCGAWPSTSHLLHGAMTVLRVQIYVVFCFLQNIFENYFTFLSPSTSMC